MEIWKFDSIYSLDKFFEVVSDCLFIVNIWTVDILATESGKSTEEGTVETCPLGHWIIADHIS